MKNRPRLKIPVSALEQTLNIAAILGLIFNAFLLWRFWTDLPEQLPSHYDFRGNPDAWGGKETLVILPVISLFLFLLFIVLERYPWIYNYPVAITAANAERQYRLARTFITWLNFIIIWFFAYIEWRTVTIAIGRTRDLGAPALILFLILIIGSTVIYMRKAYMAK